MVTVLLVLRSFTMPYFLFDSLGGGEFVEHQRIDSKPPVNYLKLQREEKQGPTVTQSVFLEFRVFFYLTRKKTRTPSSREKTSPADIKSKGFWKSYSILEMWKLIQRETKQSVTFQQRCSLAKDSYYITDKYGSSVGYKLIFWRYKVFSRNHLISLELWMTCLFSCLNFLLNVSAIKCDIALQSFLTLYQPVSFIYTDILWLGMQKRTLMNGALLTTH